MALWLKENHVIKTVHAMRGRLSQKSGTILVYIVMLMVIFGVLGVAMVSLFTTSIGSSATVNDTRRATYLSESGIRYAMSELRAADFTKTAITGLNKNFANNDYKISSRETFGLNVSSPWFEPLAAIDIGAGGSGTEVVVLPEGELAPGFVAAIPTAAPRLTIVNDDYIDSLNPTKPNPPPSARGTITNRAEVGGNPKRLQLEISDDGNSDGFVAGKNDIVCFAVSPSADQVVPLPGSLLVEPVAAKIFPAVGGAFEINRHNYYYAQAIDRTTHVELTGVTAVSGETQNTINAQTTDYVILSPRNRFIVSEGKSGTVTFGKSMNYAAGIADTSIAGPKSRNADIEFEEETDLASKLRQVEQLSNPDFITVDNTERFLTIGGGAGPSLGAVWFQDTRSVGGQREFCNANGCFFKDGIRVFFTVEYTGNGDGFLFALLNGSGTDSFGRLKNDTGSVGGDIERSEMLGYAGDSRLAADPGPTQFLDTSAPRGLVAPKIGLEFDTKVNYSSTFESTGTYCASATSLNANTRNDPGTPPSDNRDVVQYVFWGNSSLNVPCRRQPFCGITPACTGDPSYDDNRHEAIGTGDQNWTFDTLGDVHSSPALAANGTIYVGSDSTLFFAVKPDGSEKWSLSRSGAWFSPTVTSSGRIYVGTGSPENRLYAIRDDGTTASVLWNFPTGNSVTTKPAVGTSGASNGIIYFGSDDRVFRAVNSSGTIVWSFTPPFNQQPFRSSPALSQNGNTVYFGSDDGNFYARHADTGLSLWTQTIIGAGAYQSSPAVGPDGTVYVGNDNGRLYAFNGAILDVRWSFNTGTGAAVRSSPALSNDGAVVYIGSQNGILYAVNTADGSPRWQFTGASGSINSPIAVDANDHIYFGSDDNNVYALYSNGTEKWRFTTGGNVEVKPAVKDDGTVYAGSMDNRLYSINQFTNPKNLKDLLITSSGQSVGGVPVVVNSPTDWLKGDSSKGPWAVRLEITRSQAQTLGTYAYNLRTWVRQCDSANCSGVLGTFFEDTRVQYAPTTPTPRPPMIEQTINLDPSDHADFERFLFGFTSQTASGETQTATIRKFQMSFIRSGDPTVTDDPNWPPP